MFLRANSRQHETYKSPAYSGTKANREQVLVTSWTNQWHAGEAEAYTDFDDFFCSQIGICVLRDFEAYLYFVLTVNFDFKLFIFLNVH